MSGTTHLGRYRLDAVIGTGAFSTVYRAHDERLDATVALKVLADNHSLDPQVRERFLAEGRVLRRIRSPHVVAVHDLAETERAQPYLVLEHADRGTLFDRVQQRRAAGWQAGDADLVAVLRPLVSALRAVHDAEVVHRDLSPRNVLLTSGPAVPDPTGSSLLAPDEHLLVADLGLCKDLAVHSGVTVAGGTEGFRPPEQRHGPATITATADLWSLSALAVWLLTGSPPAADGSSCAAAVRAAGGSAQLARALDRGLAVDPTRRPEDVEDWWGAVLGALRPSTVPSPGDADDGTAGPADASAPGRWAGRWAGWWGDRPVRRTVLVAGLAAVVALSALLGAWVVGLGGGPQTTTEAGQVRVEDAAGEVVAVASGPEVLRVGQEARFTAEGEGVARWLWVDPSGTVHEGSLLRITPGGSGRATVRLVAVGERGTVMVLPVDLRIVDG